MNLVGTKKFPDMVLLQEEKKKQMFFREGSVFLSCMHKETLVAGLK